MSISVSSRTGKEKVIADEEKGRRGPDEDAHLKTLPLMCRVSPRFKPKTAKIDHVVFCWTPLPHRGLTWFYKEPPLPP